MLRNYLKIAWRNLIRNKAFSFINIFGLAVGMATCLLIMLYIFDETSYDRDQRDGDRIFRVAIGAGEDKHPVWAGAPAPLAFSMKADLPEVEEVTRLMKFPDISKVLLKTGNDADRKQFYESDGYYADSTFFQLFPHDFRYGNALTALNQPNSLVISEQISEQLFGDENPIGKTVKIGLPGGDNNYTVQGVLKDTKTKSHIPSNFFLSMRNGDMGQWVQGQTNWAMTNIFYTYVKLHPGTDPKAFEKRLSLLVERRGGGDMKTAGVTRTIYLQPVKEIYLHSALDYEIIPNGNVKYLYILSSIALFILLIACINFMNLSTARSGERAREVGVRKVMGAAKGSLVRQFLGESFLLCLIALVLALALAWLLLPYFNRLAEKDMRLFSRPEGVLCMMGLAVITGVLAGLYPAFYLSAFRPISVLKGKLLNNFSAALIRKGLVVFQFSVSICLVVGAIVIWQQLNFLKNRDLGFNKDRQIVLPLRSDKAAHNYTALRDELLKNPRISMVTSGASYPGQQNLNDMLFYAEGKTIKDVVDISLSAVDNDYVETLGFKVLYGRTFTKEFTADDNSIILNETALKTLGYEPRNAVGKNIYFDYLNVHHIIKIVGVIRDFHFEDLHNKIKPMGFMTNFFGNKNAYAIANVKTDDYAAILADLTKSWNKINPTTPFEYSFLDQDFQKNYEREQRTSGLVGDFTFIAILIACLGLFGLSAFSAEQRTREIGIRKVLGASVINLTGLLSKDFLRPVLISILIASPVAWYCMDKWLQGFAYQIKLSWWMFAVAGLLAVLIALITVSFQAIKAALANPVNNLRTE